MSNSETPGVQTGEKTNLYPYSIGALLSILLLLVIAIGAGWIPTKNNDSSQTSAATTPAVPQVTSAAVFTDLINTIEDFHGQLRTLTPSATGKANLQEEMRKLKEMAQTCQKKIDRLAQSSYTLTDENGQQLIEVIKKVDKYIEGFSSIANLSITVEALRAKADEMLKRTDEFRVASGLSGSPDSGDTTEIIDRIDKLVENFESARQAPTTSMIASSGSHGSGSSSSNSSGGGGRYWSDPAYHPYRNAIRSAVGRYSDDRSTLAEVLRRYDNGNFNSNDLNRWNQQLNLRYGLISELQGMALPPGSIYQQHHNELINMLSSACASMEAFSNNPNSSTRANISNISTENTRVMNRLKSFYGID